MRNTCFTVFILVLAISACSAPGPVLLPASDAGLVRKVDLNLPVHYELKNHTTVWEKTHFTGISIYGTSDGPVFERNELAINQAGKIRIRMYQGTAYSDVATGELVFRPKECYDFARDTFLAKRTPIERWDCDHIEYRFEKQNKNMYSSTINNTYLLKNESDIPNSLTGPLIEANEKHAIFYIPGSKRVVKDGMTVQLTNSGQSYPVREVIDDFVKTDTSAVLSDSVQKEIYGIVKP